MRRVITIVLLFSGLAFLGCGGGTGPRNVTQEELAKAGGSMPGDTIDPPPGRPQRPGAATPAASANATPQNPARDSGPPLAGEGDNLPVNPTTSPAATKTPAVSSNATPQNPARDSGPPLAGEGDNLPVNPSPSPAANKAAPTQPSAGSQLAGDDFDAPPPAGNNPANAQPSGNPNLVGDEGPSANPSTPTSGGALLGRGKGNARPSAGGGVAGANGGAAEGGVVPAEDAGPMTLIDQAVKSFDVYKEFNGTQRLYAHWLTEPEAMAEYPLQWVVGLNEPRLFFRWGVGVVYDAPTDFSEQPPLIGDPAPAANTPAGRGGGRGGGRAGMLNETAPNAAASNSPYANVDQTTPMGNLIYYTGDFGERLIKRLDSRRLHRDFFYGKILAMEKLKRGSVSANNTRTTTVNTPAVQAPQHALLLGDTDEGTSRTVTTNTPRNTTNTSGVVATTGTLVPGVVFLGTESDSDAEKSLLERGKSSGCDAVLIFYVTVKPAKTRSGSPSSTTKLGVHNLKYPEKKKETATLNSETVAKARQKDKDESDDPVELALDKIFGDYSDKEFRVSDMPEIKPENAATRVEALVAETHTNPLPVATEIISYHKSGLLDEAATLTALGKILGSDDAARKLLSGTLEEKVSVIEKWLPGDESRPDQSDAGFR